MEEEEAASWKDIPSSRPKEGGAIFAVLAAGPPSAFSRSGRLWFVCFHPPRGLLAPPRWTHTKLSTRVDKEKEAR